MKLIKRLIIAIIALLILIIGGAFVALQFVDKATLIEKARAKIKAETGRDVTLSEDISVGIGYAGGVAFHPSVKVRDVTVSNADWAKSGAMFEAEEASVGVALLPILGGEVAMDYITLKGATVRLEKAANGKANWEFDIKSANKDAAKAPSKKAAETQLSQGNETQNEAGSVKEDAKKIPLRFDTITLENVTLHYKDAAAGVDETITVTQADISGAGELDAAIALVYKGLEVSVNAEAESLQAAMEKRVSVDVDVSGMGAAIEVDGKLTPAGEAVAFDGAIDVAIENLAKLSELAPNLPATAPIAFNAKVNGTPKGAKINDGALTYAGQKIALNLDADLSGAVPSITFDAKANRLELNKLTPAASASAKPSAAQGQGGAASATATKAKASAKSSASGGMIPNIDVPLGAVASLPAKVKGNVKIGELVQDALTLKDVALSLNAAPGSVSAKLAPMSLAGGRVNGAVTVKASSETRGTTAIAFNAVKLNAEQLMRLGGDANPDIAGGELSMVLDITGAGNTVKSILSSANGKSHLLMNGARYDAPAIDNIKAFLTFLGGGKKVEEISIACAFSDMSIKGGVAKTNVLTLQTDAAKVDGSGDISLKDETLNLTLKPRSSLIGVTDLVPPLKLSGKWASPSVSLDQQSTLLSLGKLALGAGTGGLGFAVLGGAELMEKSDVFKDNPCVKQAQTEAPQPEQKKPEAAIKEVGKNVENTVKSIRDAFEGKAAEPGAEKKGKEERVIDGINAVKGLFGQ